MYPFLQETISRDEIVASDNRLIRLSQDALHKSRMILALGRPDVFLGRRKLSEPPPIDVIEAALKHGGIKMKRPRRAGA